MENHLPLRLKNIHYYIMSGGYSWAGELVIAKGVIYYFPVRDLAEEREKTTRVPGLVGLLNYTIMLRLKDHFKRNKSYLEEKKLINSDDSEEKLRNTIENHIAGIKQERNDQIFSYSTTQKEANYLLRCVLKKTVFKI